MGANVPYLPFADLPSGAFRWRLGLRPLDLDDWFEWGPDAAGAVARKSELNAQHPDVVFATLDDIEPEAHEVAQAVEAHCRARDPQAHLRTDLHPLDAAARLVPEDLVLMVERPGPDGPRLVFGGGSVCFPNRWDLRSKLGCTMAEVHEPVAQLNAQLGDTIDGFLNRLRPERSYWRLGWGMIETDDWFTPEPPVTDPPQHANDESWYVRVERETLRRFAQTGAVLFTIRTYLGAVDEVIDTPQARKQLAAALASLPADVASYKGVVDAISLFGRE